MSLISPPASLPGGNRPRVEVAPPYAYSNGPEAVELSARAGLELDPWQRDALELMLAVGDDGLWACFEFAEIVARQNGKGGILEGRALAGLFLLGEQLIMWSAHEYKTALEAFLRMRALIRTLEREGVIADDYVKVSNTNGEEGFEIPSTEQRLKFIARSKSSGRGFSGDTNIIDETFAYTLGQQAALMPTMSARPNPQIIYTSSPPLDGDTGEPLFALRKRADAGGDEALGFRDWGCAGTLDQVDRIDLDDRAKWAASNPALGIRITEQFVARERRSMSPVDFARERMGIWPKQREQGGAIDVDQWASLADSRSRREGDVALGVDIAPQRDYAAIELYGLRDDELGHGQLVDYRPGTDWIIDRIVELRDALDPVAIGMGRGTGASLETELGKLGITRPEDPEDPQRGQLAITTATDMAAACGQLLDAVRQATMMHVPAQPMDAAVAGARTRETGDTIAWSRKDAAVDICPLVALTTARWAFETRAHLVVDDYEPLENIF